MLFSVYYSLYYYIRINYLSDESFCRASQLDYIDKVKEQNKLLGHKFRQV
jgi:hypothetical protein